VLEPIRQKLVLKFQVLVKNLSSKKVPAVLAKVQFVHHYKDMVEFPMDQFLELMNNALQRK